MLVMVGVPGPRVTMRLVTVLSGLQDPDEVALRPGAHRGHRHHHDVVQGLQRDADVDELAGEQGPLALGKRALAFTVPVVGSTWLSSVEKTPWSSTTVLVRS